MSGIASWFTPGRVNKINILCLLLAICWIVFLPLKKEIWYDETVSVLISKGISHHTPAEFASVQTITNSTLNNINDYNHVLHATVVDNGNSFLYNVCLHWFTGVFGNTINVYLLFSKLCAVAALIAFFMLCSLFFEGSIFIALGILLLATDKLFWGMAHEIRAYEMGIFFVTMAVIYCYKYLYKAEKPVYLLLTGLFAVGAILSHYLSVYIVLVMIGYLILNKKAALFAPKNLAYLLIPVCIMVAYFYCAFSGFQNMSAQNIAIKERKITEGFTLAGVFMRSIVFTDLNFKLVIPAFNHQKIVVLANFLMVIVIYFVAWRMSKNKEEKRNLHLLFTLGISSVLFLALLSIKSQHYTALYSRYYSFSVPFSTLFFAYAVHICFTNPRFNKIIAGMVTIAIVIPCVAVCVIGNIKNKPKIAYNHLAIAKSIVKDKVMQVEVPAWNEAFLVSGFMPADYKVEYLLNSTSNDFVLHKSSGIEKIPLIRIDN